MSNQYFDWPAKPIAERFTPFDTVRSGDVNDAFDYVSQGMDKLPSPAKLWGNNQNYAVAGGVADAWSASIAPAYVTSYVDGLTIQVKFAAANATTTPTLNLNALGAKQIVSEGGSALPAGVMLAGAVQTLVYDATSGKFQLFLGNQAAAAAASAAAAATSAGAAAGSAGAAAGSAGAAAGSATAAAAAKTAAETAQSLAETAKLGSEAARDLAFNNANVYVDTTAGLAAVAALGQFTVISGDDAIRYREDAGPVATEIARFPTLQAVRNIFLVEGVKKYDSLIPRSAFTDSAFMNDTALVGNAVLVPTTDVLYKTLGIKYEIPGTVFGSGGIRPHYPELIASLVGKWVTIGYIARDAAGVFHTNSLVASATTNKAGTTGVTNTFPAAADKKFFDLDATHRFYYAQFQLAAGSDNKYLSFVENVSTAATDFIAAPFLFVTDVKPALSELKIFDSDTGYEARKFADATSSDQVIDILGKAQAGDNIFSVSNNATVGSTAAAEVTDIYPSGSSLVLPFDATFTPQAFFNMDSVAGRQGKYGYATVYAYSQTGDFTGFSVTPFLRNVAVNVVQVAGEDTLRITPISANLRRYDFLATWSAVWTSYGLTMRGMRNPNTGPAHPIYFFGFMASVTDDKRTHKVVQPYAWVPKREVMRGYQGAGLVSSPPSPWTGKKIVWMGHSIPHGSTYPSGIASRLGAGSLVDLTKDGGRITAFDTPGVVSQSLAPFNFSLEAADITAWAGGNLGQLVNPSNYAQLQPGTGVLLTQAMLDALVAFNYVNLLAPHYATADLLVFDYGVNDAQNILLQQPPNSATVPNGGFDRKYFNGATKYVYKKVLDARRALGLPTQAAIIGHHNRGIPGQAHNENVTCIAQAEVAQYLGSAFVNVADNLGVNELNLLDLSDGYHFAANTTLYNRYLTYVTARLKEINP